MGSVYRVLSCSEVDKAQQRRGALLPLRFLLASNHEHHVDRRASGVKAALLLRQEAFPFVVVAEVARDEFGEYFAGVRHEGNATVV